MAESILPAFRRPALLRFRTTTTWFFRVCRFFLPE